MAITYSSTVKTARLTAVLTDLDSGTGSGILKIGTAGMGTVLATITLGSGGAKPSGVVSGNTLTLSGAMSDTSADATGTAAAAAIYRADGTTAVITGLTVGTSGSDINLSSTSITAGQTVTITSAVITHG